MVPSLLKIEDKPIAVCLKQKDAHPDQQCIKLVHLKKQGIDTKLCKIGVIILLTHLIDVGNSS